MGERGLRDREQLARQSLRLYERAGEKGVRELARRKGYLEGEMGRIEREVVGFGKMGCLSCTYPSPAAVGWQVCLER